MALRVISHLPTINATGVYLNSSINVTFDKRINPNTVDYSTFSVNDHNAFTTVPSSYSVDYNSSGEAITAVFTPTTYLIPNTKYDVFVYGNPDSILAANGEYIQDTYSYTFTTGIETYDDDTGSGTLPSGYVSPTFTGILTDIPPTITGSITSFGVYSTDPQHQTPHVITTTNEIKVVFTGVVETPLSELSGYVTLDETPVLQ